MMRDEIQPGDMVLFYHSNAGKETGIVGTAEVVCAGYPDFTAMDPKSDHPDPKHTEENPIWYMVDVQFKSKFANPVLLGDIKIDSAFEGMKLIQKGNRLSVFPVEKKHFDRIVKMGK